MRRPAAGMTVPAVPTPADWRAFVDAVAVGGDPLQACAALGYADPAQAAAALLTLPEVRQGLVAATEARLEAIIGPLAARTVERILMDDTGDVTHAVKAKLAVAMLDRVRGVKVQRPGEREEGQGQSVDELRGLVERMEAAVLAGSDALIVSPHPTRNKADAPDEEA